MQTTMTIKSQVTIGKVARERAGLRPGMRVEVTNNEAGEVVLRPADAETPQAREIRRAAIRSNIDRLVGADRTGVSTDEFMASIRDPVVL